MAASLRAGSLLTPVQTDICMLVMAGGDDHGLLISPCGVDSVTTRNCLIAVACSEVTETVFPISVPDGPPGMFATMSDAMLCAQHRIDS